MTLKEALRSTIVPAAGGGDDGEGGDGGEPNPPTGDGDDGRQYNA
jgi:hypothetical protein